MDNKLIRAWFRTFFDDPDYFFSFHGFIMSPEYDFVFDMVLAFGSD